jgi:hypothetical protein
LEALWLECGGRCLLSGIEFDMTPFSGKRRPFAPSIDRIDPSRGYSKGNCRLVCVAVNYAMSDWGLAVLKRIAVAILERNPSDNIPGGNGFRGVVTRMEKGRTVYEATVSTPRGRIYLGRFPTGWDAHMAYREARARMDAGMPILKRREVHQDYNADPATSAHIV